MNDYDDGPAFRQPTATAVVQAVKPLRPTLEDTQADVEALNDEIEHLKAVAQRAQQREAQAVLREEELWKAIGIYERAIGNLTDTIRKLKGHP